ncbi:MAG: lipopolysaccharide kinase InaA family protein [Phycisphaerae bacterium]
MSDQNRPLGCTGGDAPGGECPIERVSRGGKVWQVVREWRDRLVGAGAPDWFSLEAAKGAELVKDGFGRKTWRVSLGGDTVFAKVLELDRLSDRLKHWTLGSSAAREWRASEKARQVGVPVVNFIGLGVGGGPLRVVLLTEGLDKANGLADAWRTFVEDRRDGERRAAAVAIIEAVGTLVGRAHERGFVHGDEHSHNILLTGGESSGQFEAYYADIHAARFRSKPVSVRSALRSLAQLDQYFHRVATRAERLRFLRCYVRHRRTLRRELESPARQRAFLSRLAEVERSRATILARQRDRRLGREGKFFQTLTLGEGWTVTVAMTLERRHVFPEADVPDRTEDEWRSILEPLLCGSSLPASGEVVSAGGVLVQVEDVGGLLARVRANWFKRPHRRAFEQCHRSRHRDIHAELILGYGEHRTSGLIDRTVLVRPQRVAASAEC